MIKITNLVRGIYLHNKVKQQPIWGVEEIYVEETAQRRNLIKTTSFITYNICNNNKKNYQDSIMLLLSRITS